MKKKTIPILAVLIFIIPLLGFPSSWKTVLIMLLAAAIIFIIYKKDLQEFFSVPEQAGDGIFHGDTYVESVISDETKSTSTAQ